MDTCWGDDDYQLLRDNIAPVATQLLHMFGANDVFEVRGALSNLICMDTGFWM